MARWRNPEITHPQGSSSNRRHQRWRQASAAPRFGSRQGRRWALPATTAWTLPPRWADLLLPLLPLPPFSCQSIPRVLSYQLCRMITHSPVPGPLLLQVAYGMGPLIQLLLGSGAHHYLEFKLVQGRWVGGQHVCVWVVAQLTCGWVPDA